MNSIETPVAPVRVLICDDHPTMRHGLRAAMSVDPAIEVVGEAGDGNEAIAAYRALAPDVTLMDIQMPVVDGLEAIEAIRGEHPSARIIALTTFPGDARILQALSLGAVAYLLKTATLDDIVRAVRLAGSTTEPPDTEALLLAAENALTARELDVLRLVAEGNSNRLIARRLVISEDTVKSRLRNIVAKLGARDRTHAVLLAVRRGLIEP